MMRRMRKVLIGLAAGACLLAAGTAYGADEGPGSGLIRTEDGRTERAEDNQTAGDQAGQTSPEAESRNGQTSPETESRNGQTSPETEAPAGQTALVPETLPDRDVLSDPAVAADTDQVIVVRGLGGSAVRAAYYRVRNGEWSQVFETAGVWGLGGCTREKAEGDKKTPCGVYRFNAAFGILDDPGTVLPYHKVTEADYWVDDPQSSHYNRMVDAGQVEKDWNSAEHLIDVSPYYNYALSLTYNEEAVPGKGSAIFLHCTAEGYPGSSGCICIPEPEMKQIIQNADERTKIVILEN